MSFLAVMAVCFLVLSASPAGAYHKAHGGHGDDRLVSRVGGAALNGRAGNDRLVGLSGKEILYGGPAMTSCREQAMRGGRPTICSAEDPAARPATTDSTIIP